MSSVSRVRAPALWTSAGLVLLAILVVLTAVWAAYDDGSSAAPVDAGQPEPDPGPEPADEPPPDPPPEAEPAPAPVHGTMEIVEVVDLSPTGAGVFQAGSAEDAPVPADAAAVDALATAVVDWLDAYVATIPAGAWPLETDPTSAPPPSTQTGPTVRSAAYQLRVGARGAPEWVEAHVTLDTDEATFVATFTFVDSGAPSTEPLNDDRANENRTDGDRTGGDRADRTPPRAAHLPIPTLVAIEPAPTATSSGAAS